MFSGKKGLTNEEAARRLDYYGLNSLPEIPPPSNFSLVIGQLKNPLVFVLLIAAFLTFIVGSLSDSVIILFAVFINTILGFVQERKATNALSALKHYLTEKSKVIREGDMVLINSKDIVPGDVVVLDQGAKVPADGELLETNRFFVDEAVISGESLPLKKTVGEEVFMGTKVSEGKALMRVVITGALTKMGTIAKVIQQEEEDTPLERNLKKFSKQLVYVVLFLTFLVFMIGLLKKNNLAEIFVISVALAVSSIPEGLLVSLTAILAIGMQKILGQKGLVRKLSSAETLGGVTVICVDKTGTLTEGKMQVVESVGDKNDLATQVLLANDMDDPIVISAFKWGREVVKKDLSKFKRIDSIPFSPQKKFFASLHKWDGGKNILFVNGAPEILLKWSKLEPGEKDEILSTVNGLTKTGKRVVGFARKKIPHTKTSLKSSDATSELEWVGILAFSDPIRYGISDALHKANSANIKIKVITGDYPGTAMYVMSALGFPVTDDKVMTGEMVDKLSPLELSKKVNSTILFARTTSEQKLKIVEALKFNGEVVSMMGDGVNDAPALHMADIGVVVGEATDVARESADLVLLSSDFSVLVNAIKEGRVMFENIRKVILYLMSDSFSEIILIAIGIILGLPMPLTAAQILWINLISDGFPNLSLAIDPARSNIMNDHPKRFGKRLVEPWMIVLIGIISVLSAVFAIISFIVVWHFTGDIATARSMVFIVLGIDSLVYVYSIRILTVPFWKNGLFDNKWLLIATFAGLGFQVLPFAGFLRGFFGLVSLGAQYWLVAATLATSMFFIIEIFKFVFVFHATRKGFTH